MAAPSLTTAFVLWLASMSLCVCLDVALQADGRWSEERARDWSATQGWRFGANYLPASASNVLDMFSEVNFDSILLEVERELRVAKSCGFSAVRVFLHEELFYKRGGAFLDDVARLLEVFSRRGVSVMLVLFDACWRPDLDNAAVIPGVHNSAWVQSPTHTVLRAFAKGEAWAVKRLKAYVTGLVERFGNDSRVTVWDIYNEPSMRESEHWILPRLAAKEGWKGHPSHWLLSGEKLEATFKLLDYAFAWARSVAPIQPLTTAVWDYPNLDDSEDVARYKLQINERLLGMSDVLSLHCYCEPAELEARLAELAALSRGVVLVTEFMARSRNSTLMNSLPVLFKHGAWGYTWGMFRGKSQTHRPWDTWVTDDIPADTQWFHDVFHANGTAYDEEEIKATWWYGIGRRLSV